MNWYKNMLLEWADSQGSPRGERVLAVFAPEAEVILIQIFDPKANPRSEQMDVLERAIAAHECCLLTVDPFFGRERGTIIKRSAAELGLSKRLVYHYLREFLQKGQHANALLPD